MAANPIIVMTPRSTKARLLRIGEPLPATLNIEFPSIDPIWTWVVDGHYGIEGCLIAAPGPGIAILLKLSTVPAASSTVIVKLLRKSLTDMANRGYRGYLVCLDPAHPLEAKLATIAIKARGLVMGRGVIIAGYTDIGGL